MIELLRNRGYLGGYEKSADVFDKLLPHQAEAIEHARERVDQLNREHTLILSRNSNPATTVYELVEFLNSQRS